MTRSDPAHPTGRGTRRRRSFLTSVCCVIAATTLVAANPARADEEDADSRPDARLMGYDTEKPVSQGTSTTMPYLMTILLGALAVAILFKGSGRTHLD